METRFVSCGICCLDLTAGCIKYLGAFFSEWEWELQSLRTRVGEEGISFYLMSYICLLVAKITLCSCLNSCLLISFYLLFRLIKLVFNTYLLSTLQLAFLLKNILMRNKDISPWYSLKYAYSCILIVPLL